MKKLVLMTLSLALLACACGQEANSGNHTVTPNVPQDTSKTITVSYGNGFMPVGLKHASTVKDVLAGKDSVATTLVGIVSECCQEKGCWMTVDIGNGEQMRVSFLNYGWFIPKNSAGREAVMQGKAYRSQVSVEDQKHYAADAGKPQAEIDAITAPKDEITFIADGLILRPVTEEGKGPAEAPAAAPATH